MFLIKNICFFYLEELVSLLGDVDVPAPDLAMDQTLALKYRIKVGRNRKSNNKNNLHFFLIPSHPQSVISAAILGSFLKSYSSE